VTKTKDVVSYRREKGQSPIYQEIIINGKVDTVTKSFNYAVKKYGGKSCLGTREILGEEDEVQKNGKLFKKLALGDYNWISYEQVAERAHNFGRGLRSLGQTPGSAIAMYAETRAEWMISCLGAFSQNIHVCTGEFIQCLFF
jgi:long-chain acyl-CoA synthetase